MWRAPPATAFSWYATLTSKISDTQYEGYSERIFMILPSFDREFTLLGLIGFCFDLTESWRFLGMINLNPWFSYITELMVVALNDHNQHYQGQFQYFLWHLVLKLPCFGFRTSISYFFLYFLYLWFWGSKKRFGLVICLCHGRWTRIIVPWPQQRTPTVFVKQCSWRKSIN